jgi:sugar phosphate isomerase/epimerase
VRASLRANPLGLPIGSQTYPHRQMIKDGNFAGLLKTLAEIGVQTIELCSPLGYADFANLSDGKQVAAIIRDHGLTCMSAHFSMRELRERQSESIAWANAFVEHVEFTMTDADHHMEHWTFVLPGDQRLRRISI